MDDSLLPMLYCLNLNCEKPENADGAGFCQNCGTRLILRNRFQVVEPIGEGGIGKTYRAQDCDKMNEPCVVKQLKFESRGTQANQKIIELFMREAQQLYEMRVHPQIPDLLAYFEEKGCFYLIQQLVEGQDLDQEKQLGLFDEAKIRALLADVLPILSFIHDRGVIHRDLKPANIMRRRKDGRLVLIDFGVSQQLSQGLTTVGGMTIVGTPGYAPFEQMVEGHVNPGPESDLYSLGVTCFELMTGMSPYSLSISEGYRWVEEWRQYVQQPMSQELQGVLDKLLKKQASQRFQSAQDVLTAMNAQANLREYRTHLAEYEQEYRRMVAAHYPLSSYLLERLGELRSEWSLQPSDVEAIEEPIRQEAEAKYQHKQEVMAQRQEPLATDANPLIQNVQGQDRITTSPQTKHRSRRGFLALLGLGGVGMVGAVLTAVIRNGSDSGTSAQNKLPLKSFSFETVRLNERGAVVERKPGSAKAFTEVLGDGIELEMVSIPGGTFTMGSPRSEAERNNNEGPQHEVTVPEFLMGKFEVTQAQWDAVMGNQFAKTTLLMGAFEVSQAAPDTATDNPSRFKGANRPVDSVTWGEAIAFCQRLSQQTEREYRLPSEAEWEYACRAGTTTPFHFGETITAEHVNFEGDDPSSASALKGVDRKETADVGSFSANNFGLYDMHGNLWEWCQDRWHDDYEGAPADGSAWMTGGDSTFRILRGGSWYSDPGDCRSAYRDGFTLGVRLDGSGFRVVLSLPRIS